jgi:hypothetical protein
MVRDQAAHRELSAIAEALDRFKADVSGILLTKRGYDVFQGSRCHLRPSGGTSEPWFGPYLENVPEVDPWGNDYVYHTSDGGRSFELFSTGPGGESSSDSRFRVTSP